MASWRVRGNFQGILPLELQPAITHRSKRVVVQSAGRTSGRLGILLPQLGQHRFRCGRQNQRAVGIFSLGGPALFVVDQVPK